MPVSAVISSRLGDGVLHARKSDLGSQGIAPAQYMSGKTREEVYEQDN
ncbi:MAG TPA: hypothetical protein VIX20_01760 [Ktedonobacteraceae bacterium]